MSTLKTNRIEAVTTSDITLDTGTTAKRIVIPATTGDDINLSGVTGKLLIGDTAGGHIAIDDDAIQAKTDGTTAGTLKLMEDGGNVAVFSSTEGKMAVGTASPAVPLDVYEMGGLICGYTVIDSGVGTETYYEITTSYAVPTSDWNIKFRAPASGKVELQLLAKLVATSGGPGNVDVFLGLSTAASYSTVGASYEKKVAEPDEDDNVMCPHSWYLSGLTPGQAYSFYIGTKVSSGSTTRWYWGGTDADQSPPVIIRAITLPNTVPSTWSGPS